MENPSRLGENFKVLISEMVTLVRLRDEVARRGEQGKNGWLRNIEGIENEVDKMRKDLHDLKGPNPSKWNARLKLNKRVIQMLKDVKVLQEEGNANSDSVEMWLTGLAAENTKRFSHGDLTTFTSNFSTRIGAGACGIVYKGQFPDGVNIAVKILRENDATEQIFMAEVRTIGRAYHRCLVKLYGFCFDTNIKAVVYEFMDNGSLDKILYENPLGMDWDKFYCIAIEIAKGLSYLHDGCHEQIIHRDVKPGNVLLDSDFCPKVSDFGLVKLMNRDVSHFTLSIPRGTPGYLAPEMWLPSSPVTYKCDVYSYGMLLFEILAMRSNCQGKRWFPKLVWEKYEIGQLDEIIKDCGIREESREKAKTLSMVALWCAQRTPSARPSMSTVVKMLEKQMPTPMPPNPFMLPTEELLHSIVSPTNSESLLEEKFREREGVSIHTEFPFNLYNSDNMEGTVPSEGTNNAAQLAYEVCEREHSDSFEHETSSEGDLLPAVEGLQISREGQELKASEYSKNETESCNVEGATLPNDGKRKESVNYNSHGIKKGDGGKKEEGSTPIVLKVDMHCEGCVKKITTSVEKFAGVETVHGDSETNKLTVKGKVAPGTLREWLENKTKRKVEIISPQPGKKDD